MGNHFAKIAQNMQSSPSVNMKPARNDIAYLCDGKACGNKADPYCALTKPPRGECARTIDPQHAKNGPCENPENYPERFEKLANGRFWEKDE